MRCIIKFAINWLLKRNQCGRDYFSWWWRGAVSCALSVCECVPHWVMSHSSSFLRSLSSLGSDWKVSSDLRVIRREILDQSRMSKFEYRNFTTISNFLFVPTFEENGIITLGPVLFIQSIFGLQIWGEFFLYHLKYIVIRSSNINQISLAIIFLSNKGFENL